LVALDFFAPTDRNGEYARIFRESLLAVLINDIRAEDYFAAIAAFVAKTSCHFVNPHPNRVSRLKLDIKVGIRYLTGV